LFSSRRRHTRFSRDWSSDVCSSDLVLLDVALGLSVEAVEGAVEGVGVDDDGVEGDLDAFVGVGGVLDELVDAVLPGADAFADARSEERRVGKEGRAWW